ncbi:MAG: PfkB family carbohydrate kinase [Caldilineaceae bacterium]|nr:PfkB family carbohydrate kinase [Caldilineaceae bacterium]
MNGSPFSVDVLCLGIACYDLIFSVDRHLGPDEKIRASELTACGGGIASNAAMTVARLGSSVAFAGYLGQDMYGDSHVDELRAAGVNTELVVRGARPTSLSAILVKPDGTRALVNYSTWPGRETTLPQDAGQASQELPGATEFQLERCRPRAVLVDGYHIDAANHLVESARSQNVPTVLDGDMLHAGTKTLMEKVEFLVVSEHFAQDYSQQSDPATALEQLSHFAPSTVITLGARGLCWRNRADSRFGAGAGSYPAFAVEVEDTTGAGDAFHGAFAAGLARGMAWEELLRFASAVGALCCTRKGARLGIPTGAEVAAFLDCQ